MPGVMGFIHPTLAESGPGAIGRLPEILCMPDCANRPSIHTTKGQRVTAGA